MSYQMTEEMWGSVKNFSHKEFGCIDMDGVLIYTLQELRKYVGKPIIIHCGFEQRWSGYHPKKCAADLHIQGLHVVDQFLVASRFDNFNGIGVYKWGLHIDTRPKTNKMQHNARWGCLKPGIYVPLDKSFFKKIL